MRWYPFGGHWLLSTFLHRLDNKPQFFAGLFREVFARSSDTGSEVLQMLYLMAKCLDCFFQGSKAPGREGDDRSTTHIASNFVGPVAGDPSDYPACFTADRREFLFSRTHKLILPGRGAGLTEDDPEPLERDRLDLLDLLGFAKHLEEFGGRGFTVRDMFQSLLSRCGALWGLTGTV